MIDERSIERVKHHQWAKEMLQEKEIGIVLRSKLRELSELLEEAQLNLSESCKKLANAKEDEAWAYEMIVSTVKKNIEYIQKQQRRFQYYLDVHKGKERDGLPVEQVKEIDIECILGIPKHKTSDRKTYLCPIHNEKTPSFVWFIKEGRYKCFGCQAYGDIIDLYMKIHGASFKEAVIALTHLVS